ncbi:MAG: hypothetical protein KGZ75_01455 [Syntrophomonadaceae bacterium]|nr:hypothetical protein [Syntrophomonadaceae bacterium]
MAKLRDRYGRFHDVKEQPPGLPVNLDLYAHFYQTNQRYFGSKKISLWRLDNEEHCLVKGFEEIDKSIIVQMSDLLKEAVGQLVNPHPDHMKTVITGVMLASNPLAAELKPIIEKFNYRKVYKIYLYGWAEVRLMVLDLSSRQVLCNPAGKEVKKFYEGLLVGDR